MSDNFNSLNSLQPLFLNNLAGEDVHAFAHELQKQKCISENALQFVLSSSEEAQIPALLHAIVETAKSGWENSVVYCLRIIGKTKIAQIIDYWFHPEQSDRVNWIVSSWNELLKYEEQIRKLATIITSQKLSSEQWLEDFCCLIASEETDAELKNKVIEMSQSMIFESDSSLSMPSGFEVVSLGSFKSETNEAATDSPHAKFEPIHVQNKNGTETKDESQPIAESISEDIEVVQREDVEPNDAAHSLSEDIESTFHSLLPLLHYCLSVAEIKNLAKDMVVSGHLSSETFQKIKLAHGQSTSQKDLLSLLIKGLKDEAKENWKTSLLEAFQELDLSTLHDVIKHFCDNKSNDDLCWLIENWDFLQDRKEDCVKIAEKLNYSKAIDEQAKSWLLQYIHQVMLAGDETLHQVVAALRSEPEKEETHQTSTRFLKLLRKSNVLDVIWKLVKKKWKNINDDLKNLNKNEILLRFLHEWPIATVFVPNLCEGFKTAEQPLSPEQKKFMKTICDSLYELMFALNQGTINISCLIMTSNIESFWQCYDAAFQFEKRDDDFASEVDDTISSKEQYDQLLNLRKKELAEFHSVKKCLEEFVQFAMSLKKDGQNFDCQELQLQLNLDKKLASRPLCNLVECKQIQNKSEVHKVVFFPVGADELKVIIEMVECLKNSYARRIMRETAADCDETELTILSFLEKVWKPAYNKILGTCEELDDGSISFQTVEQLFEQNLNANLDEVKVKVHALFKILEKSGINATNADERSNQVHNYLIIKRKQSIAAALINIKEKLNLKGKFESFQQPLNGDDSLNNIKEDTINAFSILEAVTKQQLQVLQIFCEGEILLWLKEHMKDRSEVKVMSDLAMISAGETPMEVDRVSCFLSAVMGFSPLIFDLAEDAGLKDLLSACRQVWKNVERDEHLINKWTDLSKQLEWLKYVKDLHGSVEKNYFNGAQEINERGIYVIGKEKEKIPTIDNCLMLVLPAIEEDKGIREMSLSEIHDLQSRLMLIANEADRGEKDDITRFTDVFSNVETLAKAYVKLKQSGCLLFDNWTASIWCSKDKQTPATIKVSFHKSRPLTSSKEISLEITKLTDVLNEAHKNWTEYLCEKRDKHYHLNHFNIHQLTYLCKQLSCINENDFPDQVYQLLATVSSNLSDFNIPDILEEVIKITDEPDETDVSSSSASDTKESTISKKKKVIRRLIQNDVPENAAKAAVQCEPSLDVDECYLWYMSNQCDDSLLDKKEREFDEESARGTSTDIRAHQDVLNERVHMTLDQVISRIQVDFDDAVDDGVAIPVEMICKRYLSGTAVTSLEDCISLEHLGQFLTMIASSFDKSKLPIREWPENFHAGKPSLVVCPKTDMWRTILSIYMATPDQCLPSATEVLVCSESTASEEIALFFRRAMQNPADEGKRVYCLACADEISFSIAKEAEIMYQQLNQMSERNQEYRLVVLVSSLRHYITGLFDEYQIDIGFNKSDVAIKDYICKNLSIKRKCLEKSAAVIDRGRNLVRLVCSEKAGMGKSLFVARCKEKLAKEFEDRVDWNSSIIRFLEKTVDVDNAITTLTNCGKDEVVNADPHFVHIDITPAVHNGMHKFLFDLVILGELKSSDGVIWRRCAQHFYALEYTFPTGQGQVSFSNILDLFPKINCISPKQVIKYMQQPANQPDPVDHILMDKTLLMSDMYQRPYQYLYKYTQEQDLDEFTYTKPFASALNCLQMLLKYCSVADPSWAELSHFAKFLNTQLFDCENSIFFNMRKIEKLNYHEVRFTGFKQFVVRFMIRMSQDFATHSLKMDEDVENNANDKNDANDVFKLHQLRRRWESDFHPYLFFNADRMSFSFVHFNISEQGDLCNPKTNAVVEQKVMSRQLLKELKRYKVNVRQDFDQMSREEKLQTLCNVLGVPICFDPDSSYELTTDNVLKMLAIQMRFRCGIPVVIMGDTGCGKTRMVEFVSKLKAGGKEGVQNMVVLKVHGGVTVSAIHEKVKEAVTLARANAVNENLETTLFFDEANTTEAIYAIKEVVCDATVHGETFAETGLKIVAACNPYRKHSDDVIEKMDHSGLGFHVNTEDITDTFAGIPMRHLVYRVIPLPPSMQPLVWDFGQLNNEAEAIYINQMVLKLQSDINGDREVENLEPKMVRVITKCLSASQIYMRKKSDVCSFVSLRDVERTIQTFKWFYKHLEMLTPLLKKEKNKMRVQTNFSPSIQALINSLGICYHVTLHDRGSYRKEIATVLEIDKKGILDEIIACQNVFINAIELKKDIGRNEALRENVFMMVVCAEMRIPLFLVGKPGSSKSLAKTIVTDAMQGRNSKSDLYKKLKEIQVLSFQCSAASDAVGIETVFNHCAQLQKNQPEDDFVAVLVLDEIGLAEDSPKMPLKVLHPLLENASTTTQLASDQRTKIGFVGISNWALDPAKMNRGIFVTRGKPSQEDLKKTAEAIFESDKEKIRGSDGVIKAITSAYLDIYESQANEKEFFGLRDYYGLLKMLFAKLTEKGYVDFMDIAKLVLRNFSGYKTDVCHVFREKLIECFEHVYNPKVTVMELIHENVKSNFENRFLLLLTNQYSAVSLLPEVMGSIEDYQVVFGSSFPSDNDYTEICRNINKIKVCMETGRTVVVLNLRDLYGSLYDALNQHYITFAGQNYVDLGLGGHRVKCRISEKFRLIVIEDKDVVYEKFPIPLLNRLEKHVFEMSSVLTDSQSNLVNQLIEWTARFTSFKTEGNLQSFSRRDTFPGYTDDTPASAVVSAQDNNLDLTKKLLLQTASLDGVCRLSKTPLSHEAVSLQKVYMEEQDHDNLLGMLKRKLSAAAKLQMFEVTSFSQMLHDRDRQTLQSELQLGQNSITLLTLQQFSTERSFSEMLDKFFQSVINSPNSPRVILIQCPQAQLNGNLIACAKYATMNKVKQFQQSLLFSKVVVVFLLTMERHIISQQNKSFFTSFHCQNCSSYYIDELKPSRNSIAYVSILWNMTIPSIFERALQNIELPFPVLDLNRLVSDCIPEAITKLQKVGTTIGGRNRVRILSNLCFKSEFSPAFLKILCQHILNLVSDRDRNDKQCDSWIVEVACSPQDLQEGGSFKQALWLYLRKLTAVVIAKIVSIIDVDNNLDLIKTVDNTDLWLQMFERTGFLIMHWPASRLATNFTVSTHFSCFFPFFRTVYEQLHKQWKIIDERKDLENKQERFIEAIRDNLTTTNSLLELACEGKNAVTSTKNFIHDLVFQLYKRSSKDDVAAFELQTVQNCVFSLFQARRKKGSKCISLVEAFLLYKEIQSKLQSFALLIAVNGDILKESHEWTEEQLKHDEFVAHKLALTSLIRKLHADVPNAMKGLETCEKWKLLVNKAKPVAFRLVPESSEEIENIWTNIVFVEIFLDQLVPAFALRDTVQKYLTALAPHARRLSMGASKFKNLSDSKFLNILTGTLENCTKEIETHLLCEWQDINCKSSKKPPRIKVPVLLPCGHYACKMSVLNDHMVERCCPRCPTKIPAEIDLEPVKLSVEKSEEVKRFKSACTSFLLDYLSTFCFPASLDETRQQPLQSQNDLLKLVLQQLVVCDETTEKFTGLFNNFALDLVARSYILQLLIGCNSNLVEELLSVYLETITNDSKSKAILIDVYLRSVRNILHSKVHDDNDGIDDDSGEDADSSSEVSYALVLLHDCEHTDFDNFSQLKHLDYCVSMQYIVQITVNSIHILHQGKSRSSREKQLMTQLVSNICGICQKQNFNKMQQSIVKETCQQHGMDAFGVLLESDMFKDLVPRYLIPDQDKTKKNYYLESDTLVLCGNSYIYTKAKLLRKISNPGSFPFVFQDIVREIQKSGDSIFQVLLSLSMWTCKGDIAKALRHEAFKHMTGRLHAHFAGKSYQQLFNDIAESKLDCFKCDDLSDFMQHQLTELLTLIGVTILWHGKGLLTDLAGLITNPEQYTKAFLPTMPLAGYFAVKGVLAKETTAYNTTPKAFLCPNGHLYFIGDCTKPNQSGFCPDCRQPIGGQSYDKLHAGNRAGEITEESQAGYKLKSANSRPPATPERKLSKLSVCAIRFCLHAVMLLGSRNGKAIEKMIDNKNPSIFLVKHLIKDLKELAQNLGRSVDDAIITMHEIVNRMRVAKVQVNRQACNFQTLTARETWEKEFQRHYLTLVFRDVDVVIYKARAVLVKSGKLAEKPLERLVHELDLDNNIPDGMLEWDCPYLWKSSVHIDIIHLNQKLEAIDASAGGEGSVLKTILNTENLNLIQHLDTLLDVQSSFIERYCQKINMAEADEITLKNYLADEKYIGEDKVDLYIRIWNKVRHFLLKCDHYKSLFDFFDEDMSLNSPISMCIPSKRGRGRCAYVLMEYLIDKQNSILQICKEHIEPRPSFAQVDASKCTKNDIICISKKKDLMPLLLANHRHEKIPEQTGLTHKITYNFGLLEKKIMEKFILRKAEIKFESVPLMLYPQDVGLNKDCTEVLKHPTIKQVSLPVRMCHDVDASVENSRTANICEAVRTLTVVIQFLAKLGAEADQTICNYSEKELLLPTEETEMIPRSAEIRHCLALFERFSWHRSKRLIQNGQNPFKIVLECAEDIKENDVIEHLKEELKGMNIERLQLALNALMMIGPEMQPEWSLGEEVLLNYLDTKNDGDNSWCKRIPSEILYKHAAHVFRLSMQAVGNN